MAAVEVVLTMREEKDICQFKQFPFQLSVATKRGNWDVVSQMAGTNPECVLVNK